MKASLELYQHLVNMHWDGGAIVGADPVGKINWRMTRFVRSYLPWLPGAIHYTYVQGQAYWIRANLSLYELTKDSTHLELVDQCADHIVQSQLTNGAWKHPPIPGRQGFISTVESVWACLGLAAAYRKLSKPAYLNAILKGYDGLVNIIGFGRLNDSLAINYHAHTREMVPNVTTMFLWLLAEIYQLTDDKRYLEYTHKLLRFLEYSQMENGELEYIYGMRPHFQCYQYNSFQFLDLANYFDLTNSERAWDIINRMVLFLSSGLTERGSCRYDCIKENPETNYWTAVLAAAMRKADQLGLGKYEEISERAYRRLISRRNSNGSFYFSDKNYGFLADRQSYPRQQAMILHLLLLRAQDQNQVS